MLITLYFTIALFTLYIEARDFYKEKIKIDYRAVIFSLIWIVSLPFAIYVSWKEIE